MKAVIARYDVDVDIVIRMRENENNNKSTIVHVSINIVLRKADENHDPHICAVAVNFPCFR